jgi:hypothetical protein
MERRRLEEVDEKASKELRRSWCVGSEAYGFVLAQYG